MRPEALPDVLAIAADVATRLESTAIRYVIGGSLASSLHGEPRATMYVDMITDLSFETVARMCASLRPDYYVDEHAGRVAVRASPHRHQYLCRRESVAHRVHQTVRVANEARFA